MSKAQSLAYSPDPRPASQDFSAFIEAGKRNIQASADRKKAASKQRREQFLSVLREVGIQKTACDAMGISFHTPSTDWLHRYPEFKAQLQEAQDQGRLKLLDAVVERWAALAIHGYERPVYQKGRLVGKERCYSPTLIESFADRLTRGTFAQSPNAVNVTTHGPAAVQINLGGSVSKDTPTRLGSKIPSNDNFDNGSHNE